MAEIRIPDLGDFDEVVVVEVHVAEGDSIQEGCLLYTSPSPRDLSTSRMPSSA